MADDSQCTNQNCNLDEILSNLPLIPDFESLFDDKIRGTSGICSGYGVDPRIGSRGRGTRTLFSKGRHKRPRVFEGTHACPVCEGELDPKSFIMARKIPSDGYAFVTGSKYSFLNPDETFDISGTGVPFRGVNLLVWPTSEHKDIAEMAPEDHSVTFAIFGELEERTIKDKSIQRNYGYQCCQVVKNIGTALPGSHLHGPYHVALMNVFPKRIYDDMRFLTNLKKGKHQKRSPKRESFVKYFERNNPDNFTVREYETMKLVVPYFTRRPLEAIIYPKDENVEWFSDLNDQQRLDLAQATSDVSYALSLLMPAEGLTLDFNLAFHTGPIGTMYVEVFPSSQRPGGFERMGLYVCEGTPPDFAKIYKKFFEQYGQDSPEERYTRGELNALTLGDIRAEIIHPVIGKRE